MARYHGVVGYAHQEVVRPGVTEDILVERSYYGNVTRDSAKWRSGEFLHKALDVSNVISIVADAYAEENVYAMRYATLAGQRWNIASVEIERPRLILRLGGVYNGPVPENP